ncbi:MAG: hypothetical protein LBJ59_05935, partial [Zoogloeaceae bacterium]|nr:hypothetical protein [Zoogloeaceae bacterium]
ETDLPDYAIIIHGVKGSSYGIEASRVGQKPRRWNMRPKRGTSFLCAQTRLNLSSLPKIF